jgi:hypothetical protein
VRVTATNGFGVHVGSDEKLKGVKKKAEKTRLREINDGGVLLDRRN